MHGQLMAVDSCSIYLIERTKQPSSTMRYIEQLSTAIS